MNFFDVHFERRNGHTVRIRGMLMIMPAKEDKTPPPLSAYHIYSNSTEMDIKIHKCFL